MGAAPSERMSPMLASCAPIFCPIKMPSPRLPLRPLAWIVAGSSGLYCWMSSLFCAYEPVARSTALALMRTFPSSSLSTHTPITVPESSTMSSVAGVSVRMTPLLALMMPVMVSMYCLQGLFDS